MKRRHTSLQLVESSILLAMMASGMNPKFYFSWLFTHRERRRKKVQFKTLRENLF
jgi:hypothetical protein